MRLAAAPPRSPMAKASTTRPASAPPLKASVALRIARSTRVAALAIGLLVVGAQLASFRRQLAGEPRGEDVEAIGHAAGLRADQRFGAQRIDLVGLALARRDAGGVRGSRTGDHGDDERRGTEQATRIWHKESPNEYSPAR